MPTPTEESLAAWPLMPLMPPMPPLPPLPNDSSDAALRAQTSLVVAVTAALARNPN